MKTKYILNVSVFFDHIMEINGNQDCLVIKNPENIFLFCVPGKKVSHTGL